MTLLIHVGHDTPFAKAYKGGTFCILFSSQEHSLSITPPYKATDILHADYQHTSLQHFCLFLIHHSIPSSKCSDTTGYLIAAMPRNSVFYRVQDDSSATQFDDEDGFIAGDEDYLEMYPRSRAGILELSKVLAKHLDWSDRDPSPFISAYSDKTTAYNNAESRVLDGHTNVVVVEINVKYKYRLYHWPLRAVAKAVGLEIELKAWHNSKFEEIFLHRIPWKAIDAIVEVEW